jgi:glycosyltransferase involved in cell wall biosynthesis
MKLLLVNYELPPIGGGAGNATAQIARHLAAAGDEVRVLTSSYRGLPRREARDGYLIWRVPAVRRRPERCSPAEMLTFVLGGLGPALDLARAWRPEVACAFFGLPSGPLTLALERIFGIPYLVSLRGGDVPGFLSADLGRFHRLTRSTILTIWRHSRGLIANSAGLAELTRQTWPDAAVHVVPNGVDTDAIRPPNRCHTAPATPLRVLCVGRLVRQKGFEFVLEALSRARAPSLLRIVGDGPLRARLASRIAALGLEDRVDLVGWVDRADLPAYYQWADVLCLPSFEEGMPNVVLEAMAAGLPVIASDVYGIRDLVEPGNTGCLIPPADPAAIACAVERFAAEPALVSCMGDQARAASMRFAWPGVAAEYRRLLVAAAR